MPTEHRLRMVKLIRDLTSCYEDVLTIHAEGSLEAQKMSILQLADWGRVPGRGHAGRRHPRRREAPGLRRAARSSRRSCRAGATTPTGRRSMRVTPDIDDADRRGRRGDRRTGRRRGDRRPRRRRRRARRARARALAAGQPALDEWHSKQLLAAYGVPVPAGALVTSEAGGAWPRPRASAAGWP